MDCDALRDDQWERLKDFVPGGRKGKRGPRSDNRRFLNALLWMARSGARWRDLPDEFGDYEAVKRRYYRWIERGVLDEVLAALSREADLEPISTQPAQAGKKGGACPGPWPVSRRLEHQDPRRRRRAWQSGASDRLARTA